MSETKLTPAQKRAIREARKNRGSLDHWLIKPNTRLSLGRMGLAEYVVSDPCPWQMALTPAGWAVEVGNEDR